MEDRDDMLMDHVNTNSRPGDLKITDIRVADIVGAPMHCTLVKVYTNQGLVGYGTAGPAIMCWHLKAVL